MEFIDLKTQYRAYRDEIHREMQKVMDQASFIMGPAVSELEEALGDYVGTQHAIGCSSGTDALLLALMALDIRPGDEVIIPAYSFMASAEMVSLLGARPVFVDIREDDYNIDPERLETKITPRTRAIMPVSLYGQPYDADAVDRVAKEHDLPVIEDAAQSFGAIYRGRKSGKLSLLGCTSFFPSKPLGAFGDGGAVFTQDDDLARKIRILLNHGSSRRYFHEYIGLNARLDSLQAAVLKVKLRHLDEEIEKRREIAARYNASLSGTEVALPEVQEGRTSVYAQYSIRMKNRDSVADFLNQKGIPTAIHYPRPLYAQPIYSPLKVDRRDYPVSETVSKTILSLPMGPFLSQEDQDRVVSTLQQALRGR